MKYLRKHPQTSAFTAKSIYNMDTGREYFPLFAYMAHSLLFYVIDR